jgi:radical SAM superfamily enzyme YgiQ (UPF0313 family)
MSKVDIVLVNPSDKKQTYGKLGESLAGIEPPLWHALLAAFVRSRGFSVKIIDSDAEGFGPQETVDKIIESSPALVGIGAIGANPSASSTPKMIAVHLLLKELKKRLPALKTVLYGIHPSGLPERTFKEESVDFICRGEAFYPVTELLAEIRKGNLGPDFNIKGLWYRKGEEIIDKGWANIVENLDDLPFAAWDLLSMEKYKAHNWHCFGHINQRYPYAITYTSLGCPFDCHYCNIHALYSGKPDIRFRSSQKVIEEIDLLVKNYNVKNVKFLDELFVIKRERFNELCDLLIERDYDLNIWAYARIDTADEQILRKMLKAGVRWLCYGIEAGSKDVRAGVNKGRFDIEMIKDVVNLTRKIGIYVIGNFMFGLPDDTFETMQETKNLAEGLNCEYVNYYTTMAYPGSRLYEDSISQGIALPDSWKGFSQYSAETLPLPTKHVSAAAVLNFRDKAFVDYYKRPEYLKMIKNKFGKETVEHIRQMLSDKIHRNILEKVNK